MKKIRLLLSLIILSVSCYAQQVGKIQHVSLNKVDTFFVLAYTDLKFTHIQNTKYIELNSDELEMLKKAIENGFSVLENTYVETKEDYLKLEFTKSFGLINLQITHVHKASEVIGITKYITYKSYLKLFGLK